jgi:bacterial leucyl aminopeptidase
MKFLSVSLILVYLGVATALPSILAEQTVFSDYEGFKMDLNAQRLVQMEGQTPVWMTELEKVPHDSEFITSIVD